MADLFEADKAQESHSCVEHDGSLTVTDTEIILLLHTVIIIMKQPTAYLLLYCYI